MKHPQCFKYRMKIKHRSREFNDIIGGKPKMMLNQNVEVFKTRMIDLGFEAVINFFG